MTDWELETIGDFDGTFFDDGTGWKVLFKIHMGISIRAQITNHPVRLTTFNRQLNGIVWTEDIDGIGTKSLPRKLRELYSAIESLVGSSENIRWTESSGRSPEWTIESLIEDIGMGEFEPLIRPQKPEPFVWLIAALERLAHPKIRQDLGMQQMTVIPDDPVYVYRDRGPDEWERSDETVSLPSYSQIESAWNSMYYKTSSWGPAKAGIRLPIIWWDLVQSEFPTTRWVTSAAGKTKYISLVNKTSSGQILSPRSVFWFSRPKVTEVDYICRFAKRNYAGPNWTIKIGSSDEFEIGTSPSFIVESNGPDLDFEGSKTVSISLLTEKPTTLPFNWFRGLSGRGHYIQVTMTSAWVYFDLPENMAVGELSAPEPSVLASAEQ